MLKGKIREQGITFPVMVDKKITGKPGCGKTFRKYMVDGFPTDIRIDKNGHINFKALEKELINYKSKWIEISKQ